MWIKKITIKTENYAIAIMQEQAETNEVKSDKEAPEYS